MPNASAGVSVVYANLAGLDSASGGEIVVTDHGYGAVTMGAERLARRWGGRVRTARVPLDADEEQAYEAVMAEVGDATGLVVVDQITSATARRSPWSGSARRRPGAVCRSSSTPPTHPPCSRPPRWPDLRLLGGQPPQVGLRPARYRRPGRPRPAP